MKLYLARNKNTSENKQFESPAALRVWLKDNPDWKPNGAIKAEKYV